jgi:general L-amino acid transport system permease protein
MLPARQPPQQRHGWSARLRANFWQTPLSALTSVVLLGLVLCWLPAFIEWAWVHAEFAPDAERCQALRDVGACWGVVSEKYRVILFGRYPYDAQWRPVLAMLSLTALLVASCIPRFWSRHLAWSWLVIGLLFFALMGGGSLLGIPTGLDSVASDLWGGLPLTLMLATLSIALAFPLAILIALGRRSDLPAIRSLCTLYVELIRGVPLISLLFMASFMFPLLMPSGTSPNVLLRVLVAITLFSAAYTAEIVRAGLQAIPRGQVDAALSLGLSYWQIQRQIVLPQALAHVVPSLMNNFIAIFKDTSLVTIVSLYELSGALGLAINGDPDWRPFKLEAYLFITLIYFLICFAMSRYSLWVERQIAHR